MKLLLDQGAPRSAAALLRRSGFDAVLEAGAVVSVQAGRIRVRHLPIA